MSTVNSSYDHRRLTETPQRSFGEQFHDVVDVVFVLPDGEEGPDGVVHVHPEGLGSLVPSHDVDHFPGSTENTESA